MKLCSFCAEQIQDAAVVCKHCGRTLAPQRQAAVFRGAELGLGFGAFCLVAALLFAGLGGAPGVAARFPVVEKMARAFITPAAPAVAAAPKRAEEPPPPPPPPPPLVLPVFDTPSLHLPPGEHFDTAFVVADPRPCTFLGHVQGIDGGRRDVEVYLFDEDGHLNWHNGLEPVALYESGRTSSTSIEVPLREKGTFHLLISNRWSVLTSKTVQIDDARVICE